MLLVAIKARALELVFGFFFEFYTHTFFRHLVNLRRDEFLDCFFLVYCCSCLKTCCCSHSCLRGVVVLTTEDRDHVLRSPFTTIHSTTRNTAVANNRKLHHIYFGSPLVSAARHSFIQNAFVKGTSLYLHS